MTTTPQFLHNPEAKSLRPLPNSVRYPTNPHDPSPSTPRSLRLTPPDLLR